MDADYLTRQMDRETPIKWPFYRTTWVSQHQISTSGYAMWFTAGGATSIAHFDVIVDVITRKL